MWYVLLISAFILLTGYAFLIEKYRSWFIKIEPFNVDETLPATIHFSVIVPARNEEDNIKKCLPTLLKQHYPSHLFEVIVINDHSTDNTAREVALLQKQYSQLRLFDLEEMLGGTALNSYKKKAIELAVAGAAGDWIVTTDADCIAGTDWLQTLNYFIQKNDPLLVAAPVQFIHDGSFLSLFQCLDFLSLQGITAASVHQGFHSMCNGANLAYSKKTFKQVGGFAGIDNIASGDDMLLMHKIYSAFPGRVKFLLSAKAIIKTTPMPTLKSFINQRIRWASKADAYDDKRIFWVLALVYLLNVLLFVMFLAGIFKPILFLWWGIFLLIKTIVELRFMRPVALFFKDDNLLKWFGWMQPFHIAYTVIAGWLGKFGSYQWKERTVK